MSPTGDDALDTVWEFLAYLLTALVFLVVGLAFPIAELLDSLGWILCGVLGVAGRAGARRLRAARAGDTPAADSPGPAGAGLPLGWLHVLFWAGLRGAVAVAMALALPVSVPERTLLQEITFGIVLFTLIVQGTTAGLVVRRAVGAPGA